MTAPILRWEFYWGFVLQRIVRTTTKTQCIHNSIHTMHTMFTQSWKHNMYTKLNNDREEEKCQIIPLVTIDCKQLVILLWPRIACGRFRSRELSPVWANYLAVVTTKCDDGDGLFGSEVLARHLKVQKWNSEKVKTCTKILYVCPSSLWPTLEICQFLQFWCRKETAKDKLKASP